MAAPAVPLYYFISFSMPSTMIDQYLQDADHYGGTVVIRGIHPKYTLKQFILTRFMPLVKKHTSSLIIHPELFKRYHVQVVPTLILRQPNGALRKIQGAVSTSWAIHHAS